MTKSTLHLGSLRIPISDFSIQGNAILGIRDSGKTYTATVAAEQLIEAGIAIIAFDPIGVWRNLRIPGKGRGYPVVVAGGKNGDLPLTPASAPEIVHAAMQQNISLVLDLYSLELSKADWKRIVADSVRLLLHENKAYGLRHLFIEEAAEFCLSADTEILTVKGWKTYAEINVGDAVIAFDAKTDTFREEPIQRIITKPHDGEMIQIKQRALDCLMTPDHRAVIKRFQHDPARYKYYDWAFCAAKDLPQQFGIPVGGSPDRPDYSTVSDELLRILGWAITDGNIHDKSKSRNISICQSSATVKNGLSVMQEMDRVLRHAGATSTCSRPARITRAPQGRVANSSPSTQWYLGRTLSQRLWHWLGDQLHRVPRILLENCSHRQLKVLYEGLLEGNGTFGSGHWRNFYAGKNEGMADDFQELASRLGVRALKCFVPQNGQWVIRLVERSRHWVRAVKLMSYTGIVWDVTVPSGAFIARRNGSVFVTGNCPQRIGPDQGVVYAEVEKLGRMGGNAGLGFTLISQRAEELNKAVLELCDLLALHRQKGRHSLTALGKWLDIGDVTDAAPILKSLPTLPQGECWVWPAGTDKATRVKVQVKNSFHPDRRATATAVTVNPKAIDVSAFVAQMTATLEKHLAQSRENDPAELRRRIVELQKQLKQAQAVAPAPVVERVEVPVLTDGQITQIENLTNQMAALDQSIRDAVSPLSKSVHDIYDPVIASLRTYRSTLSRPSPFTPPASKRAAPQRSSTVERPEALPGAELPSGARRMLQTLAQRHPLVMTRSQLGTLAGFTPSGGTFSNYFGTLRRLGYLTEQPNGDVAMTQAGLDYLGADVPAAPTSTDEELDLWRKRLPVGAAKMLDILVTTYPASLTRQELGDQAGFTASGGTFSNYLGLLRRNGLAEVLGDKVRAANTLFHPFTS